MLEVTETKIRKWAAEIGVVDLAIAELDLRLTDIMWMIYSDRFLGTRLYLKGGTAINKLYLRKIARLSVDLDFNSIGTKEQVLVERKDVRDRIITMLKDRDPRYFIKKKDTYELTTVKAGYTPLFGRARQYMKIEISNIERFPVLCAVAREMKKPVSKDVIKINTYAVEELMATKLRALYERLKGRDAYDVYFLSSFDFDKTLVKKLLLYYFYRSKKIFNPNLFFKSIKDKFMSEKYVDDVSGFVRADVQFSMEKGIRKILSSFSFLSNFDESDVSFLTLARYLLGQKIGEKKVKELSEIKFPLRYLFKADKRLSKYALDAEVKDLKMFVGRQMIKK